MKVWVAEHLDIACEEQHLLGIFTTEEKAKEALKKYGWVLSKPYAVELDEVNPEDG